MLTEVHLDGLASLALFKSVYSLMNGNHHDLMVKNTKLKTLKTTQLIQSALQGGEEQKNKINDCVVSWFLSFFVNC